MSGSAELEDIRLDSETDTDQGVCVYVCMCWHAGSLLVAMFFSLAVFYKTPGL